MLDQYATEIAHTIVTAPAPIRALHPRRLKLMGQKALPPALRFHFAGLQDARRESRGSRCAAVRRLLALGTLLASATVANCAPSSSSQTLPPGCEAIRPVIANGWERLTVGQVWSGVHTAIGTANIGPDLVLAAYYNPNRYLTLARIDVSKNVVCRKQLPSRFGGWDAHNGISMAVSSDGTVHIVGNMHASQMFYAAGKLSNLDSIRPQPMTGRDEQSATYPQFLRGPRGALYFVYRSGHAGNGQWIADEWNNGHWQALGPIFSDRDSQGPVSAYPTPFKLGSDGRFHVAIVWRRTYDIDSNFAVTYASTTDFRHWSGIGGESSVGPLGPASLPPIERTGENAGLLNNPILVLDDSSRPTVIYSRYADRGPNAVFGAEPFNGRWRVQPLAVAERKLPVVGTGTLSGLPSMSLADDCGNGVAQVHVNFPPRDLKIISVDRRTSTISTSAPQCPTWHSGLTFGRPSAAGMADVSMQTADVRQNGVGPLAPDIFYWFAQGANRDRPRQCTRSAPLACAPTPSDLILVRRAP